MRYDFHHIMKAFRFSNAKNTLSVIPSTDEQFISLSYGVWIKDYVDKNGKTQNVFEYLRFLDSYKFMQASLESLVKNLPVQKFGNLHKGFPVPEVGLLRRKGHYPYSYIDNFAKFDEAKLPPIEGWRNNLKEYQYSVTDQELRYANRVFKVFKCRNIGDYHDLYLKTDVLLLADVFEEFRQVCYETYGLDPVHYFTASNLAGDSFLKTCRAIIDQMTERIHLDLVERLIRGGIASVFSKRVSTANSPSCPNFNPSERRKELIMLDVNNLYGGIMEKFPLPRGNFTSANDVKIETILATSDNSKVGYIVEVDIEYPDYLHDEHADFPLAPTKDFVDYDWLVEYQTSALEGLPRTNSKVKKL